MFSERLSNHKDVLSMLNRIDEVRIQKKISKGDLYMKSGITASAISQWRSGKTKPSLESVTKIAEILGVSVDELFDIPSKREINTLIPTSYQQRILSLFDNALKVKGVSEAFVINNCNLKTNPFLRLKNRNICITNDTEMHMVAQYLDIEQEFNEIMSELSAVNSISLALNIKHSDMAKEDIEQIAANATETIFKMANEIISRSKYGKTNHNL